MKPIFPIEELRRLAVVALDLSGYAPAESARIRAIPDVRTIRYYTTLGLIDGPAEMQGRTAFYTLRHVEQLVAIKRLQARGLTLADVQQEMLGLSAAKLARLADLPDELEKRSSQDPVAKKVATPSRVAEPEPAFWKRVPKDSRQSESGSGDGADRVWRIKLDEHTTLEVNALASGIDVAKIREAARPLIDELLRQQLIQKRRSSPREVNDE